MDLPEWPYERDAEGRPIVYFVESGEYSDYGVDAVCLTKDSAERLRRQLGEKRHDIAEHVLELAERQEYAYKTWIYDDGEVNCRAGPHVLAPEDAYRVDSSDYRNRRFWMAYGDSPEHALKNASDYRAFILAQEAGI